MTDLKKTEKDLSIDEIAATIAAKKTASVIPQNQLADKLRLLGYHVGYDELRFPYPFEFVDDGHNVDNSYDKEVVIRIGSYCGGNNSHYDPNFSIEVHWKESHRHDDDCDHNCDIEYEEYRRDATVDEMISAIRNDLMSQFGVAQSEFERSYQLAISLPTEEEIAKMRRRVEEEIRKDHKKILPVAKLLGLFRDEKKDGRYTVKVSNNVYCHDGQKRQVSGTLAEIIAQMNNVERRNAGFPFIYNGNLYSSKPNYLLSSFIGGAPVIYKACEYDILVVSDRSTKSLEERMEEEKIKLSKMPYYRVYEGYTTENGAHNDIVIIVCLQEGGVLPKPSDD